MEQKELKAGMRLKSALSDAEVIVVRAPDRPVVLTLGGAPMLGLEDPKPEPAPAMTAGHEGPVQLGKRYVDEASGAELLVTKPGEGALAMDDNLLTLKTAKPLPSSD